jgi:N-acetylmuramoyl-L-alanine amidase
MNALDEMQSAAGPQPIDPTRTLALTLDGEAEGCGVSGMTAVACVVLNRVKHAGWWGSTIASVCLAPYQFSCWLPGPDRTRIEALPANNAWLMIATSIAARAVAGQLADITNGADSYYARSMHTPPAWAAKAVLTYEDGWHRFYRTETAAAQNVGHATVVGKSSVTPSQLEAGEPTSGADSTDSTDALNDAELSKLGSES